MRLCPFDGGPVVPEPELDGETVDVRGLTWLLDAPFGTEQRASRSDVSLAPANVSVVACAVCGRRWLIEP